MAGPRRKIYFDPSKLKCGIVTCGGLCPGINDVIEAIVMELSYHYGVRSIFGFRYGFEGLSPRYKHAPLELTPEVVTNIYLQGGTIFGFLRGNQDVMDMVDTLERMNMGLLFAIGGDGTLRGAQAIAEEIMLDHGCDRGRETDRSGVAHARQCTSRCTVCASARSGTAVGPPRARPRRSIGGGIACTIRRARGPGFRPRDTARACWCSRDRAAARSRARRACVYPTTASSFRRQSFPRRPAMARTRRSGARSTPGSTSSSVSTPWTAPAWVCWGSGAGARSRSMPRRADRGSRRWSRSIRCSIRARSTDRSRASTRSYSPVFAEKASGVARDVAELERRLRAEQIAFDLRTLPGVGEGFADPGQPDRYDANAARVGWDAALARLRAELA